MNRSRNSIAIEAIFALAALCATGAFASAPAGLVTRASGPVFAQGGEGRAKVLSEGSAVASGDTLVTGKDTYAQVLFADEGVLVLGPDTQLEVAAFSFDAARPANDRAQFALARGAVQVAGGAIAKRGGELQRVTTPLGTLAGAQATFLVTYAPSDAAPLAMGAPARLAALSPSAAGTMSDALAIQVAQNSPPAPSGGTLAPGLYVHVIDGIINLSNKGGSQSFAAGQFGFTSSLVQPPVVVPSNPGLQFNPPPAFSSSSGPSASSSGSKPKTVDCEVR